MGKTSQSFSVLLGRGLVDPGRHVNRSVQLSLLNPHAALETMASSEGLIGQAVELGLPTSLGLDAPSALIIMQMKSGCESEGQS